MGTPITHTEPYLYYSAVNKFMYITGGEDTLSKPACHRLYKHLAPYIQAIDYGIPASVLTLLFEDPIVHTDFHPQDHIVGAAYFYGGITPWILPKDSSGKFLLFKNIYTEEKKYLFDEQFQEKEKYETQLSS